MSSDIVYTNMGHSWVFPEAEKLPAVPDAWRDRQVYMRCRFCGILPVSQDAKWQCHRSLEVK